MLGDLRQRRLQGALGGFGDFAIEALLERVDLFGAEDAFAEQPHLHARRWGRACASASRSAAER